MKRIKLLTCCILMLALMACLVACSTGSAPAAAPAAGTETAAEDKPAAKAEETTVAEETAEAEPAAEAEQAEAEESTEEAAEPESSEPAETAEGSEEEFVDVPKDEQYGTAGSRMPLKDNLTEAEKQIKIVLLSMFEEIYGDEITDARIEVEKMYDFTEEQEIEPLREMELGMNDLAFEVRYDLKPAEGADVNLLSIPNGEYDEASGWVVNNTRIGVLRYDPNAGKGNPKYVITDFGTGW